MILFFETETVFTLLCLIAEYKLFIYNAVDDQNRIEVVTEAVIYKARLKAIKRTNFGRLKITMVIMLWFMTWNIALAPGPPTPGLGYQVFKRTNLLETACFHTKTPFKFSFQLKIIFSVIGKADRARII